MHHLPPGPPINFGLCWIPIKFSEEQRFPEFVLNMALDAEDCLICRCPQIDSSIVQACVLENKYQLLPSFFSLVEFCFASKVYCINRAIPILPINLRYICRDPGFISSPLCK
uniref:Uncharacterized protein n=1 Tax=Aegilops tauschii subsp. strangulata TaxID=200361 RepID=A0A453GF23_AEGTS